MHAISFMAENKRNKPIPSGMSPYHDLISKHCDGLKWTNMTMVWVVQILAPVVYQCSERMFFVDKTQTFSWQNWPVSYLLLPQMVPDINWNIRNSFPDPLVGWMDAATQDGWFAKTVKREAGIFRNLARSWIFQKEDL